jgi:hypothetical protein
MGALISDCGLYRYWLSRDVQTRGFAGVLTYIMLNPSTADATKDDATIRRCTGFALRNDFERFRVVNLFAYRATDPKDLKKARDPIGPDNMKWIKELCESSDQVVCAWGAHGTYGRQNEKVVNLLSDINLYALGFTKHEQPKHPLYVPKETEFMPYKLSQGVR